MVLSLAGELNHPEIDAFLSAADQVMNSNTLLLKVRLDGFDTERDCSRVTSGLALVSGIR